MPISIHTANLARSQYDQLEFCYLCGKSFTAENPKTRDHVPPKAIFKSEDRNYPILLPAHSACNQGYALADEQIAQLVALLHGAERTPARVNVLGTFPAPSGEMGVAVNNLAIGPMLTKIIRGCHAILYNNYMSAATGNMVLSPVPTLDEQTMLPAAENKLIQHEVFCKRLKETRNMATVDRVLGFNGKFEFNCCWARSDNGSHILNIFGMRIYNWERLGDRVMGRPQGCLGFYVAPNGEIPKGASLAYSGDSLYRYREGLNPFEIGYVSNE